VTTPAPIRIATRGSALALRQATTVLEHLEASGHAAELVVVETRGDRDRTPFRLMQAQGIFTKAVQEAVLTGEADAAIHSYKDLPSGATPGLAVVAVSPRADARDTLLVRRDRIIADATGLPLPPGARVGTGSIRRRKQLLANRSDLSVADLRGNVPTRIDRLRAGDFDAIVVAAAGLERLGLDLSDLSINQLDPHLFVPAPAQGALALEASPLRRDLVTALRDLHDDDAARAIAAERGLMARFEGGCQLALGAYATIGEGSVTLRAWYEGRSASAEHATPEGAADLAYETLGRPDPTSEEEPS
jgi:hydroxymethylbilane synthase